MSMRHAASAPPGRGMGESLIIKRRQREDSLASYSDCVKGINKMNSRAEWEQTLAGKSETRQVQRVYSQLRNQQESQLHSRRLR